MTKYQLSIDAAFTLEADTDAAAQAQAEAILHDFLRQTWGPHGAIGQYEIRQLFPHLKHPAEPPRPDLTILKPPPGWQDQPSYRTGPDYRLLLKLPQGADPALELRLDNRRKSDQARALRIKPHNTPEKTLTRYGTPLENIYSDMLQFNAQLRADPANQPELRPVDAWLDDLLEFDLLLQASLIQNENRSWAEQNAGRDSDLNQDLRPRMERLYARIKESPFVD